jgi:hypothetical protein
MDLDNDGLSDEIDEDLDEDSDDLQQEENISQNNSTLNTNDETQAIMNDGIHNMKNIKDDASIGNIFYEQVKNKQKNSSESGEEYFTYALLNHILNMYDESNNSKNIIEYYDNIDDSASFLRENLECSISNFFIKEILGLINQKDDENNNEQK